MISFLKGFIEEKNLNQIVLNVNGIGYEINIPLSTYQKLPSIDSEIKLYIIELQPLYGSTSTLYGFLTKEEKDLFCFFKDELKNVKGRKALDYVDKVMKSLPIFQESIINKNTKALTTIFGFKKKTAEKIIAAISDKINKIKPEKMTQPSIYQDALEALKSLGYKHYQAKNVLDELFPKIPPETKLEDLIKLALKNI